MQYKPTLSDCAEHFVPSATNPGLVYFGLAAFVAEVRVKDLV